jgi:hypothetical protein
MMTQPVDHFRGPPQTSRPKSLQWAIENQWLRAFFVSYWRSRSQRSPKVVSIPPIAQALNRRPFGSSAASQPRGRKAPLFAVEISSTLGNSVQGASIPDLPTGADLWGSDTPRDGVWSVSYFTFENFFDRLSRLDTMAVRTVSTLTRTIDVRKGSFPAVSAGQRRGRSTSISGPPPRVTRRPDDNALDLLS